MDTEKVYRKTLVGRYSPQNGCRVPDDEFLVVAPGKASVESKSRQKLHYFVGIKSRKRSKFGWVVDLESPITARWLAEQAGLCSDAMVIAQAETMLEAVEGKASGTPYGCYFVETVSAEAKRSIRLRVHQVVLHKTSG